ncbi:hypothetical protein [Bradyrhizobium diazoefficiens]|uniref:hypothetical protein n=1 Tax=Bradyrhizobium diazoefficiens TaxID=1355477 RepID=UPI001B8B1694|nr:hypothetical protein [Bradyrhizobium diazoefficiens]MBR0865360.1 hypothetical protein [Bradyrhizobium diazoefficiens]MBR0889789.1 hypothetical protein [Bradyrhizobium diazoefficiens]MBR0921497.1 hypothetical protein [Bradyrhizobium diazoefficiens]
MAEVKGWGRPFDDLIDLPDRRQSATLREAATYITALPKAVHDTPEWQAPTEALLLVAERGGPVMFARIGGHAGAEAGHRAAGQRRRRAKRYRVNG